MAEDNDVLEDETAKEEDEGGSFVDKIKTKLSAIEFTTTLLIKIAIGVLTVLLIGLVIIFFMPKEEPAEPSTEAVEQEASMEGASAESGVTAALSEISGELTEAKSTGDLSEAIEGNVATATEDTDLSVADVDVNLKDASGAENADLAVPSEPEDTAMELFKLREQTLLLEEENRRLKRVVTRLQRQANTYQGEPSQAKPSSKQEREEEFTPEPTWGEFPPLYQGQ